MNALVASSEEAQTQAELQLSTVVSCLDLLQSSHLQVLIALRYLATNGFQNLVCDSFGCSQQVVSQIVHRVVDAFCQPAIRDQLIRFPSTAYQLASACDGCGISGGWLPHSRQLSISKLRPVSIT
ncbi:hypothetical protein WR25_09288 [Diploscapter pachys]|uniref:Transposase Helix-turn-helix domain-containing protein n=1 Tax=Diploscapter pachys TaxID=2018661 RepID=A0A2A2LE10_9BILA|nr:hypothetical protein WR25_09288 [Diploscapter pachys]